MNRVLSLYLPDWPIDRVRRRLNQPAHPNARRAGSGRRECAGHDSRGEHPRESRRGGSASANDRAAILLIETKNNVQIVAACSREARVRGVRPGMALAHAKALLPSGEESPAGGDAGAAACFLPYDPAADLAALRSFALWAMRFSPAVAVDPPDGLLLDITGCQRLFRGEGNLLNQLLGAVRALGFDARGAIADTIGAAWAVARGGPEERAIVPADQSFAFLAHLRPWTLRIAPAIVAQLEALGIERIEALMMLPRSTLPSRFGEELLRRLDQALGRAPEVLAPVRPPVPITARINFEEPLEQREMLEWALNELIAQLVRQMAAQGCGARRVELMLFRFRDSPLAQSVTLCAPSRSARHLGDLLRARLAAAESRGGVEGIALTAPETGAITPQQGELMDMESRGAMSAAGARDSVELFDRLGSRLGTHRIVRPQAVESHWPERAWRGGTDSREGRGRERIRAGANCRTTDGDSRNALACGDGPNKSVGAPRFSGDGNPQNASRSPFRPLRLLLQPIPMQAMAIVPDGPPIWFRCREGEHRVRQAAGPERLMAEWWSGDSGGRDYYRLEDDGGAWLWVFRDVSSGQWYIHGMFE